MDKNHIMTLLREVADGTATPEDVVKALQMQPFEDLGYAKIDHHRSLRQGTAEVIYGAGKTPEQIIGIASAMRKAGQETILITRLNPCAAQVVADALPLDYRATGRLGILGKIPEPDGVGTVLVVSGGTSDMDVAEEAAVTAEVLGNHVTRLYDVGVAGIHRLLSHMQTLVEARVVISVAGMEGALTSVVGGLVSCPVIGVPTSVGYGAAFGGVAALLSMLNSCASGVSVVNIDNGFGAGFLASRINHMEG